MKNQIKKSISLAPNHDIYNPVDIKAFEKTQKEVNDTFMMVMEMRKTKENLLSSISKDDIRGTFYAFQKLNSIFKNFQNKTINGKKVIKNKNKEKEIEQEHTKILIKIAKINVGIANESFLPPEEILNCMESTVSLIQESIISILN